jgi:hypothetical protein
MEQSVPPHPLSHTHTKDGLHVPCPLQELGHEEVTWQEREERERRRRKRTAKREEEEEDGIAAVGILSSFVFLFVSDRSLTGKSTTTHTDDNTQERRKVEVSGSELLHHKNELK